MWWNTLIRPKKGSIKRKHNGVGSSKRPIGDCDNKKRFKGTCFVCNKT
jgi:hypothetical protein